MKVPSISDTDDWNKKINSGKIIVCDFTATWCGPCKRIAPHYQKLSNQLSAYSDVVFVKVDVDECKEVAVKCKIESMPTFQIWDKKELIHTFKGASQENLKNIKKYIIQNYI